MGVPLAHRGAWRGAVAGDAVKLTFIASLGTAWFTGHKDGSGTLRIELPASEFTNVIHMSRFMDCFTKGGATFKVTIEEDT
jgi:hypothetical protein